MPDLQELYQEIILEHSKVPRNFRTMETANFTAEGYNPLCGDHYTIFVEAMGDTIRDVSFQGSGCAISKASASMMSEKLKGKCIGDAEKIFRQFHRIVTGEQNVDVGLLGKLEVFAGVANFPTRIKCATLAWHTLQAAIHGERIASTE